MHSVSLKSQKKLLIFDGTFRTTTFINRRAELWAKDHQVFIAGFNEQLSEKVPGVKYVPVGSNDRKIRLLYTSFYWVVKTRKWNLLLPVLRKISKSDRRGLQQQNIRLAVEYLDPDEIHLQWPSVIPWFETLLERESHKIYLWQRGYHINVRPFVDQENMAYLQKWFPKLTGFISVSKAIAERSDSIWNAPEKQNRIVYTTLPLANYPFRENYTQQSPLQLISVGRKHWKKGYDYALRACALLKQAGIPFQYTIIGAGGFEELVFLKHDLKLNEEVILEPGKPHVEVISAMQSADLFLLPSLEEGLPNVVVEAMALGVPVIATHVGGIPELIVHHKNGLLVPSRNPEALAQAIQEFLTFSNEKIEALRRNAREAISDL